MSEWIKCEERLPETGAACLIVWSGTVHDVAWRRVGLGYACCDGYEWETVSDVDCDTIPDDQVTHWMPLPAPPEVSHD